MPKVKMISEPEVALFNASTTVITSESAPAQESVGKDGAPVQESGEDRVTIVQAGSQKTHNNSSCNFQHLNTNVSLILNTDPNVANVAGLMVVGHCILAMWVFISALCCCCCCVSTCCCCCVGHWYRKQSKDDLQVDNNTVISAGGVQSDDASNSPSHDLDVEITHQVSAPLPPLAGGALPTDHTAGEYTRDAANAADIHVEVVASGYSLDLDNPMSVVDDFDLLSSSPRSEDKTQPVSNLLCKT